MRLGGDACNISITYFSCNKVVHRVGQGKLWEAIPFYSAVLRGNKNSVKHKQTQTYHGQQLGLIPRFRLFQATFFPLFGSIRSLSRPLDITLNYKAFFSLRHKHKHKHKHNGNGAHNTSISTSTSRFCSSCACASAYVKWERAAVSISTSVSPPSCFTVSRK